MKNQRIRKSSRTCLEKCLLVRPDDSLLILSGRQARSLAEVFYEIAMSSQSRVFFLQTPMHVLRTGTVPAELNALLHTINTLILIDSELNAHQLHDTLSAYPNLRVLCISTASQSTFNRWMDTDFTRLANSTNKISDLLSIGNRLHLHTPDDTQVTMSIKRRKGIADTGVINGHGNFCSLPAGEVRIRPEQGSVEGRITVQLVPGNGKKPEAAQLIVSKGLVKQIRGNSATAENLRKALRNRSGQGRSVVEFSFGTNFDAEFGKSSIEDVKVQGSATVAIGSYDNKNSALTVHAKAIMLSPTLSIDGRTVLQNGILTLP